jgi:Flp pilus assembly pilin Flp
MALLQWLWLWFRSHHADDLSQGQALIEYALILILASIVAIALVLILGSGVEQTYKDIMDQLPFWDD